MIIRAIVPLVLVFGAGCAAGPSESPAPAPAPAPPTRVILFIGDGVGASYWTAARLAADSLAVESFRVVGLVDTRSASHKVTDSAAGATVYATGVRTYNGAIGVGPDTLPRRTVLEVAEERGLATGLVATSTVTHATPGSFAAHVASRSMEAEIARQMARQGIEVILGGGRQFFDGSGRGASDLLPELTRRYTYVETPEALRALRPDTVEALLGLFAAGGMDRAIDGRRPTLEEMTRTALAVLDRDAEGFFLMVEGSQPDWRGHANEPLEAVTAEMLDYDRAIGAALEYQQRHPETLIVVVADHETGGLAIQAGEDGEPVARYTTDHHTAQMIPLFAKGPGAERFGGLISNARVGQLLMEAVRGALARVAVTSP
ncbi:MAG TPA: alkaline phosphatase [Longimicrobiales bacterium]